MSSVLGGLAPATFLRRHWQKRPLLVRQAVPGFAGILDRDALFTLARRADVTSRLVLERPRRAGGWERHDGPLEGLDAAALPARAWTLLVHGIESLVPGGWELLGAFDFIPTARIDDLMVSYAAPGGSVGPHDDQYDVFLLQGPGRRRWQVAAGGSRATDPAAAIKVLRDFRAEEEWLLEPGDMLYLPPGVAHWGVAEDACFTYSIGFLAPSHRDLVASFLGYLGEALPERIDPARLYEDPDLTPPRDPAAIGDAMIARVSDVLRGIRWERAAVEEFLGRLLTQPRAVAGVAPPSRPLGDEAFARRLAGRGRLALALPCRGLVRGDRLFLDGRMYAPRAAKARRLIAELLRRRFLPLPLVADDEAVAQLADWYRAGQLTFTQPRRRS